MNTRTNIFGVTTAASSPLITVKKPCGARANDLLSIPVTRKEARRDDMRLQQRHSMKAKPARVTCRGATHDVQVMNLGRGGAMIAAAFEPALWDRIALGLREHESVECSVVWIKQDRIGLEFAGARAR